LVGMATTSAASGASTSGPRYVLSSNDRSMWNLARSRCGIERRREDVRTRHVVRSSPALARAGLRREEPRTDARAGVVWFGPASSRKETLAWGRSVRRDGVVGPWHGRSGCERRRGYSHKAEGRVPSLSSIAGAAAMAAEFGCGGLACSSRQWGSAGDFCLPRSGGRRGWDRASRADAQRMSGESSVVPRGADMEERLAEQLLAR
jgi:hypothetical protein